MDFGHHVELMPKELRKIQQAQLVCKADIAVSRS
jgi:hypothetical protein